VSFVILIEFISTSARLDASLSEQRAGHFIKVAAAYLQHSRRSSGSQDEEAGWWKLVSRTWQRIADEEESDSEAQQHVCLKDATICYSN
jgi:hypothetical protein